MISEIRKDSIKQRGTVSSVSPLSICLVAPVSAAANGGTAAYLRYLGNHLIKRGHAVSGISRIHTDVKQTLAFDRSDSQTQPTIPFDGWTTSLIAPSSLYIPVLQRLVSLMTREFSRPLAISLFNSAYRSNITATLPDKVDVIHYVGTGWEMLSFAACQAAKERGAAFTITPFVHHGAWGDSPLDIQLYNLADAVFVCTDLERDHLIEKGVSASRIHKTGMAPASEEIGDAGQFRERHRLGNRPLILFMGRKRRYKGYHVLREAMAEVIQAVPEVCLVVAGPEGETPYPVVPEYNLLDLGELKPNPIDGQHKADAFAASDIYAMPSTGEAFGIVYTEAWAYARPVIGGMAPALAELIQDDINGYRVEQDAPTLARTLIRLLKDDSLRARLGTAGYALQQSRFTWNAVVQTHETVFQKAISQKSV